MKVHNPATMDVGQKECKRMILEYGNDPDRLMIKVALKALTNPQIMLHEQASAGNPISLGVHAQLFGNLAKVNQTQYAKIWHFFRESLFKNGNMAVSQGCSKAII